MKNVATDESSEDAATEGQRTLYGSLAVYGKSTRGSRVVKGEQLDEGIGDSDP